MISLAIIFLILSCLRFLWIDYSENPFMLRPPAIYLISMLINIVFFRLLMINLHKEKAGKGFLFSTVLITFIYLFILK